MKHDELTRRQFLINTARSYLGVSLPPLLGASIGSQCQASVAPLRARAARSVIFLNMNGGMSHIDTFDPKPESKRVQGPVEVIQTAADGIRVTEYLPKMAQEMDKVAVINSMNTTQGAHEQGQYMIHRSYPKRGTIVHPAIGSWVLRLSGRLNGSIPGFVTIAGDPEDAGSGFLGARYAGVPIGNPKDGLKDSERASGVTEKEFRKRLSVADSLNKSFHSKFKQSNVQGYERLYDEAVKLMRSEDLKAFDISDEPKPMRDLYGDHGFGQGCLLARRLVEHRVKYVEVTLGGWDSHYDNFTTVPARCAHLDQGMSALLKDLDRRGLLEETLVVLGTEFGRTPEIVEEHRNGRDHFPRAFTCLMAGGGIQGGQSYGRTDRKGMKVVDKLTTIQDFNATIAYALGIDHEQVITSPSGRPFRISDKGKPITDLF
ncbi:MAG: DUF1501 domain-containing protein [Verrucomicrobiota bacterium]